MHAQLPRPFARLKAALAVAALLSLSACQFLQNEFCSLNRVPPSARAPAPAPQPW